MPLQAASPNVVRNIMKPLLTILFAVIYLYSFGQKTLHDIKDKTILDRIEFIKSKTDSFLLSHFQNRIKPKFQFEFLHCGYTNGEFLRWYGYLDSTDDRPNEINNVRHNYSFTDKDINLNCDINVYFYQYNSIELHFQTTVDSLKFTALDKIYNQGQFQKIKAKIQEVKFKQYYTVIQVNSKLLTYDIIVKDKSLPHNYFIN